MEQRPKTKANLIAKTHPDKKRILVVGMGFKVGDGCLSNSPGLALSKELLMCDERMNLTVYDPLVKENEVSFRSITEKEWSISYLDENFDLIVIAFKQKGVDLDILPSLKQCKVVHPQYLV
jgi:UDP-N-acetyl-D-mannosaminuronate dehydrogenase